MTGLMLFHLALAANPVTKPILKGGMDVHIRRFAKIPDFQGAPARIICIVPREKILYVCTLTKIYSVTRDGTVALFMDVAAAIKSASGRGLNIENKKHGGLRSIAFHPNFARNRLLYISAMENRPSRPKRFPYVSDVPDPISADGVIIEFAVSRKSKLPIVSSYRNVLRVGMPVFDHPIKQIAFRRGFLYIAHGDGSVQSAVAGGGQKNDALGKILRINPLKKGSLPYTIPGSNPFVRNPNMTSEVWALGFRNPHHICFGKDGTLYVADAGRSNVEEINLVVKGGNYGWSLREGTFVHKGGGLLSGIRSLPADDAKFGFIYPSAQVGHDGPFRAGFIGQAIAGACPVENGSPMSGHYYYSDFPESGKLYFSRISELKAARTTGKPEWLKQARTRQARIFYDHDDDPGTPPLRFESLGNAMRSEPGMGGEKRVDVRFGRGSRGELYWSSKKSGRIYLMTSSLRGGPGGPP